MKGKNTKATTIAFLQNGGKAFGLKGKNTKGFAVVLSKPGGKAFGLKGKNTQELHFQQEFLVEKPLA